MDLSFDSPTRHPDLTPSGLTAPLLPLAAPRLRSAPGRRFLYGWNTRSTVRHMLNDSVQRLRYLDTLAPLDTCRPIEPESPVPKQFQKSIRIRPLRLVRYGVDENMLASIAAEPAVAGSREPLQVIAPSLAAGLAPMRPLWAQAERPASVLKTSGLGCEGFYIPQVSVRTLHAGFMLGKAPVETPASSTERRGVIIPFEEIAAAATPAKERVPVLPLRRLSS
ncbi:MAG: hypothetical protein JST93_19140 [Acidobacteria bacterium]|nr:hypothetical protein [Acidobacteriota bacterium]